MVGDLIRPVASRDYEALAELIRRAFAPPAERLGLTPDNCPVHPSDYTVDWVHNDLAKGRCFFVLEEGDELVGCVGVCFGEDSEAEMTRLGVEPDQQGRGFGSALVGYAERYAQREGAREMSLHLLAELDDLRRWYEHRGYDYVDTIDIDVVPSPVGVMTKRLGK